MRLRDDYARDTGAGVARWNRVIERIGIPFRVTLPSVAFNRTIGTFAPIEADPDGAIIPGRTSRPAPRLVAVTG